MAKLLASEIARIVMARWDLDSSRRVAFWQPETTLPIGFPKLNVVFRGDVLVTSGIVRMLRRHRESMLQASRMRSAVVYQLRVNPERKLLWPGASTLETSRVSSIGVMCKLRGHRASKL